MQDLRHLQSELMSHLLTKSDGVEDYIVEGGPINKQIRLAIYSNAYIQRLRGVIDTDHEILSFYLGDDLFDTLVEGYIKAYPSHHTSLRDFCSNVPTYLKDTSPFSEHPVLAELARFEQTLLFAFDANDAATVDIDALKLISLEEWPNIRVRFHPSVQLFETTTNCVDIWQAMKKQSTPPPAVNVDYAAWIVWRNHERVTEFKSLPASELEAIKAFLHGGTLADVCENLMEYHDENEISNIVVTYLHQWLARKQVINIVS